MPEFTSPRVEEFWNHFHSPKSGQFTNRRYSSGAGKGLFSIARTSKRGPKRSLLGFKPRARQSFSTPHLEEFYNHVHDHATGKFSGRAAGHSATKIPQGPQHGNRGGPVVGAKLPLYNSVTGRINPLPVRHAFKQGLSEIIGRRKEDSKRTTLKATGPVRLKNDGRYAPRRKPLRKTETVATYKGRVIKHITSKGGADRAGFREGG